MLALGFPALAAAASGSGYGEPVVEPSVERREVAVAAIDDENFELGLSAGLMNVEDFGTNSVRGARLAYHVADWAFVEALYGETTVGLTSNERYGGVAPLLEPEQRRTTYLYVTLGWNLLPGEVFVAGRTFTGALYLSAGAGSVEFAGDRLSALVYGFGYRLLPTDWLALHLDARVHSFDSDIQGEMRTMTNLETALGLTFFF